jgi:cyanophycinase
MSALDKHLLQLAGGADAPVRILPAAAAPDNNHQRAGENGLRWFKSLGATDVEVTYVIDHASANDPALAESLRKARLVYLLGGFPGHLAQTLFESLAWEAIQFAHAGGAVLAGSSAGAMILCQDYYDPYVDEFRRGLDLLPNTCLIPHHASAASRWLPRLREQFPGALLLGVDECTALLREGVSTQWTVHGSGSAALYPPGSSAPQTFSSGQSLELQPRGNTW